ncbi:MAG TPA: ABC transporter substrate-binding protein [Phycisphaerales bacterium]|nr:ABC transporter substrate-binding protein [Phycisphaerales bacterium]
MKRAASVAKVLGLAALMGLAGVVGCKDKSGTGGGTAGGGNAGGSGNKSGEVLIGHFGSLTGSEATFGQSTDNGIKLAIEEVNAAGGVDIGGTKRKVRLVSEDTEGKPEKAGPVVTKLITKDEVVAVLGEVASSVSLAGAPICQQYGVPMITPSSTNPDVTKKGDMIFRVCFIDPFQGLACAKFARNDLKANKVAVLFDQASAYSVGLKDEFAKAFKAAGGEVVSEQAYTKGASDFNAQLARIRESSPDVIFVPGYYTDVANVAIQARKLGMTMPLLGGDGWDSENLAKNAGQAIEGSFYSNHYAPDQPTPEIQEFVTKYKSKFGGTPDGLAALGYDAARLLFQAMDQADSVDGSKLRDAIASTKGFKGVTGVISINAERDAVKPAVIVEMKGGVPVWRATVEP